MPESIIAALEDLLGNKIVFAETAWGGYSPSAAFFATLEGGRAVFIKGAHPNDDSHATQSLRQELAAYRIIPGMIDTSPRLYGDVSDAGEDGWHLAIFERLTARTAVPWEQDKVAAAFSLLGKIHTQKNPGLVLATEKIYIERFLQPQGGWLRIAQEKPRAEKFLSLFEDKEEGQRWLDQALPILCKAQEGVARIAGAEGILHQDLRGDNFLFDAQGKGWLIDWPNACFGPVVLDAVPLIADMHADGVLPLPRLFELYTEATSIILRHEDIEAAIASYSGHLADQAYRAVPAKLPRLRWMQKRQLWALLGMAKSVPNIHF